MCVCVCSTSHNKVSCAREDVTELGSERVGTREGVVRTTNVASKSAGIN